MWSNISVMCQAYSVVANRHRVHGAGRVKPAHSLHYHTLCVCTITCLTWPWISPFIVNIVLLTVHLEPSVQEVVAHHCSGVRTAALARTKTKSPLKKFAAANFFSGLLVRGRAAVRTPLQWWATTSCTDGSRCPKNLGVPEFYSTRWWFLPKFQ